MRLRPFALFAAAPVVALTAAVAGAQAAPAAPGMAAAAPAMPEAPAVGAPAPDFTLATAGATGPGSAPLTLAGLRGKVVVLAFYPKDRTTGCTAQLHKFRDEYATMFGGDVVVVPVSADGLASHEAWAREAKFPFALASDSTLAVADKYGSRMAGRPMSARTAFVINRDGVITYRDLKFNALSEDAYARLAAAVKAARGA